MADKDINANGWTALPVDAGAIFGNKPFINEPSAVSLDEIKFPDGDPVVRKTAEYAKKVLQPETFNHSMRVYYFGMTIAKQQFPEHFKALNTSTWALACLLHDLGTAPENLTATHMSFDIYGGIKAISVLKDFNATTDQAEAAAEATIRHQDIGVDGTISFLGQLIQLGTLYDNTGDHPRVKDFGKLIHPDTRRAVNEMFARNQWCEVFARTIEKEEGVKPWCHSTHIVDFTKQLRGNQLMREWE
ncbi:cyanamide hydratase [Aspergillus unguis]